MVVLTEESNRICKQPENYTKFNFWNQKTNPFEPSFESENTDAGPKEAGVVASLTNERGSTEGAKSGIKVRPR